jgi:hypothetical protein
MPGRSAKAKGSKYEREIVQCLQEHGYPHAERKLAGKTDDTGDIEGGPTGWTLELKNQARFNLAGWLDEAEVEAINSGNDYGAVLIRRKGSATRAGDYVVISLSTFLEITRE